MINLPELLESFNRKERFFLISQALGRSQLNDDFRAKLGRSVDLTIPEGALIAMDYHLDWLTAALYAYKSGATGGILDNPGQQVIKGNQEDIDLLIAFDEGEQAHVVLAEAKGVTGWKNDQMQSKADRLRVIFGPDGERYPGVVPHFCLLSPRIPQQLKTENWPRWMTKDDGSYCWLELKIPKGRVKVTRCDADGKASVSGDHFRIIRA